MSRARLALPLLFLASAASACTTTNGPHQPVHLVVTQGGEPFVELPTGISVGPNGYCGQDLAPPLSFDGRFAAWSEPGPQPLHVVDTDAGTVATYPAGKLTRGHLALLELDGYRPSVTLVDLRNGTSRAVAAPANASFVGNFEGAVVARSQGARVSVLDPVRAAWLLLDAPLPAGHVDVRHASPEWLVLAGGDRFVSYRVATGEATAVRNATWAILGLRGDRLYVGGYGGGSGDTTAAPLPWSEWSVRLPDGGDRQPGGLPPVTAGGRTASFRVVDGTTSTGTSGTPAQDPAAERTGQAFVPATPALTPISEDAAAHTAAAGGTAGIALLAVAALAMRRRLP
ncbi:MAG TPA: hypothetical protein VM241_00700 [Candidatus Thermoplasmatota archaeon]|nr:hypothetical protein [Candidatus Thermoplasmatota archaeon]